MPTTYIRQLRLSHFRSHKAAHLELDGRPVALYGANGAGKTNVLEALWLLSPGRGLRRADGAELMRRPETLGWRIDALLRAEGQDHALASRATPGQNRTVEIDGKPAPQTALGQLMRLLWLVPAMDRLWTEGAAERRRFIDRLALSFNPAHAEATLTYEKAMRERNRLLKDQVRDAAWYEALEQQMAQRWPRLPLRRVMIRPMRIWRSCWPVVAAAIWRRGARFRARTGPIYRPSMPKNPSPRICVPPASKRRCSSR